MRGSNNCLQEESSQTNETSQAEARCSVGLVRSTLERQRSGGATWATRGGSWGTGADGGGPGRVGIGVSDWHRRSGNGGRSLWRRGNRGRIDRNRPHWSRSAGRWSFNRNRGRNFRGRDWHHRRGDGHDGGGVWATSTLAGGHDNCARSCYQVGQYTTGAVYTGLVRVHGQLVIVKVVACASVEVSDSQH